MARHDHLFPFPYLVCKNRTNHHFARLKQFVFPHSFWPKNFDDANKLWRKKITWHFRARRTKWTWKRLFKWPRKTFRRNRTRRLGFVPISFVCQPFCVLAIRHIYSSMSGSLKIGLSTSQGRRLIATPWSSEKWPTPQKKMRRNGFQFQWKVAGQTGD